ncbi:hypothetical protein KY284_026673 [Solanum tuberosum]|nr:hypothetical protein KY284_026673 [Solanum tuberosum]
MVLNCINCNVKSTNSVRRISMLLVTIPKCANYGRNLALWTPVLNAHACTLVELDRHLIQFLMGLNEVYTVVRGSILMMNPLPTMAHAFSILAQEERHREVKPHGKLNLDSTSLHVNVAASFSTNFRTNYASSSYKGKGEAGHTKYKFYKLHGFPSDFKFTKGKNASRTSVVAHGFRGEYKGKSSEGSEDRYVPNSRNTTITNYQLDQLVSLLEHIQTQGGNNTGNSAREVANNIVGGTVNFAGPFNEEPSGDW